VGLNSATAASVLDGSGPSGYAHRLAMSDQAGRIHALTMATAIRPWGRLWLPVFCAAARNIPVITAPLRRLAFIRAAHWTIVHAVPDGKGGWERLRPPQLLFETNFDVDLGPYIETFAQVVPWHMRGVWASAYGYPGVPPMDSFKRWVDEHRFEADHYWCAYPEATTKMVKAGLQIADRLRDFEVAVADVDDDRFALEYDHLLIELQRHL
jgi:hypothetical protein